MINNRNHTPILSALSLVVLFTSTAFALPAVYHPLNEIIGGTSPAGENYTFNGTVNITGALITGNTKCSSGQVLSTTSVGTLRCVVDQIGSAGSGTIGYVSKFTDTSTLGNSIIFENSTTNSIGINTTSPLQLLTVAGDANITGMVYAGNGLNVTSGSVSLPAGSIHNAAISDLDWTKLQNYPDSCAFGFAVQAVGDILTCVNISSQIPTASNVSGAGTINYLAKFINDTYVGNSLVYDNGDKLCIGCTNPDEKVTISSPNTSINLYDSSSGKSWKLRSTRGFFAIEEDGVTKLVLQNATGNVGIGTTTPQQALDVVGYVNAASGLCISGDCRPAWPDTNIYINLSSINASLYANMSSLSTRQSADNSSLYNLMLNDWINLTSINTTINNILALIASNTTTLSGQFTTLYANLTSMNASLYANISTNLAKQIADNATIATVLSNIVTNTTGMNSTYYSIFQAVASNTTTLNSQIIGLYANITSINNSLYSNLSSLSAMALSINASLYANITNAFHNISTRGNASASGNQNYLAKYGSSTNTLTSSIIYENATTGYIGIGTTSPSGKLHVYSGSAGTYTPYWDADELVVTGGGNTGLSIVSPDANNQEIVFGSPGANVSSGVGAQIFNNYNTGQFVFTTYSPSGFFQLGTNGVDMLHISSSGNVGIGTTTPQSKLDVNGNATIRTGGSAGHAVCWKADGATLGYCTNQTDSTGWCHCV